MLVQQVVKGSDILWRQQTRMVQCQGTVGRLGTGHLTPQEALVAVDENLELSGVEIDQEAPDDIAAGIDAGRRHEGKAGMPGFEPLELAECFRPSLETAALAQVVFCEILHGGPRRFVGE